MGNSFGFIFQDSCGAVYMIRQWGAEKWMFYWNECYENFVSYRPVMEHEIDKFINYKMSENDAKQYWDKQLESELKNYPKIEE